MGQTRKYRKTNIITGIKFLKTILEIAKNKSQLFNGDRIRFSKGRYPYGENELWPLPHSTHKNELKNLKF